MDREIKSLTFGKMFTMRNLLSVILLCLCGTAAFAFGKQETKRKKHLGPNMLSFAPLQVLQTSHYDSSPDVAIGISFERVLDNEVAAIKLPVSFSLKKNYYYIMPVLKLYPMKQGPVKYAIGPQLLVGMGDGQYTDTYVDPLSGMYITQTRTIHRRQLGFLINNSLNFTVARNFYMGMEAALGIIYYDNLPAGISNNTTVFSLSPLGDSKISEAFNLNFCMGFRF